VAEAETPLERTLADEIMRRGDERPVIRQLHAGEFLFRQHEPAASVALVLDGVFEVRVNGDVVGHVGPGTVVGERGPLEAGRRTADLCATTDARTAEVPAGSLDLERLSELAEGHHREDG
jgi:CRP-like cAMP-binding protein